MLRRGKSLHKRMGYSQAGATHLTENEKVKTMSALCRLDAPKLALIGKRMVNPGGNAASIAVTAGAEMNLSIVAHHHHGGRVWGDQTRLRQCERTHECLDVWDTSP